MELRILYKEPEFANYSIITSASFVLTVLLLAHEGKAQMSQC